MFENQASMSSTGWRDAVRLRLLGLRGEAPAWGYQPGLVRAAEPTALASLAILAAERGNPPAEAPFEAVQSARWLAAQQQPDGSLGVTEARSSPGWPTPLAVLLWENLDGFLGPRRLAQEWLLRQAGLTAPARRDGAIGHDPSLVGWAWVAGTHSWLEPTATAVLALRKAGRRDHVRVRQGIDLIRNRAVAGGGWNYGNSAVFGRALRAQPAPTGLALLALAGRSGGKPVDGAIGYLRETLPAIRAGQSLGWGLLGLSAWQRRPADAETWLAEAAAQALADGHSVLCLAALLMAGAERALECLLPGLMQ